MKLVAFIMAFGLIQCLNAAAAACAAAGDGFSVNYDGQDPVIVASNRLAGDVRSLVCYSRIEEEVDDVEATFDNRIAEGTARVAGYSAALRSDIAQRIRLFFDGAARRVAHSYRDLLQVSDRERRQIKQLLVEDESTYLALPYPAGCVSVKKGQEQFACNHAAQLVNNLARYNIERNLLVGLRAVDNNQLIMFVIGAGQLVKDGQIIVANQNIQRLYAAYANPGAELRQIFGLEYAAAQSLLPDGFDFEIRECSSLKFVDHYQPEGDVVCKTIGRAETLRMLRDREYGDSRQLVENAFAGAQRVLAGIADESERNAATAGFIESLRAALSAACPSAFAAASTDCCAAV